MNILRRSIQVILLGKKTHNTIVNSTIPFSIYIVCLCGDVMEIVCRIGYVGF